MKPCCEIVSSRRWPLREPLPAGSDRLGLNLHAFGQFLASHATAERLQLYTMVPSILQNWWDEEILHAYLWQTLRLQAESGELHSSSGLPRHVLTHGATRPTLAAAAAAVRLRLSYARRHQLPSSTRSTWFKISSPAMSAPAASSFTPASAATALANMGR